MVARAVGIVPTPFGFGNRRSANCAIPLGPGRDAPATAASPCTTRAEERHALVRLQLYLLDDGGNDAGTHGTATFANREAQAFRSEEHTSELQSLMRISYAVFCLKKKKYHT